MQTLLTILSVFFVSFTDKQDSRPIIFSDRALEQRTQWAIPTDSLDYAVSSTYTDSLRALGGQVMHVSRWLNGATVKCEDSIAGKIAACSFVKSVEQTRDETNIQSYLYRKKDIPHTGATALSRGTDAQLALYNLPPLFAAGHKGGGIVVAVIDGGFQNYPVGEKSGNCLSNIFDTAHWLGSFDFTDETEDFYGTTGNHGTKCLGLISGEALNYTGAAPAADYYLMRSEEEETESPKEMDNLVVALEKADSLGVNIVSISLGYSEFDNAEWNFGYSDMNGHTTRCTQAAQIAARKGMLVCVAAGNEGNNGWHYLTSPADADSILCVGAVDSNGAIAAFSSKGPSSDGRVKPDVCAMGAGTCIVNPNDGNIQYGNGTSFACPLIAGMAACIWSAFPIETAMQIRQRIIQSSDRYMQPDSDYGYGIPDAWAAYNNTTILNNIVKRQKESARKILRQGQIYILRGENMYDVVGRMTDVQ